MSFATLPDSGCEFTLFELNSLFGSKVLLRSVIPVNLMIYKMKNMCCSDVPIPTEGLLSPSEDHQDKENQDKTLLAVKRLD
eukprot:204608-Pelagomonas_calceolata.AAC.1